MTGYPQYRRSHWYRFTNLFITKLYKKEIKKTTLHRTEYTTLKNRIVIYKIITYRHFNECNDANAVRLSPGREESQKIYLFLF